MRDTEPWVIFLYWYHKTVSDGVKCHAGEKSSHKFNIGAAHRKMYENCPWFDVLCGGSIMSLHAWLRQNQWGNLLVRRYINHTNPITPFSITNQPKPKRTGNISLRCAIGHSPFHVGISFFVKKVNEQISVVSIIYLDWKQHLFAYSPFWRRTVCLHGKGYDSSANQWLPMCCSLPRKQNQRFVDVHELDSLSTGAMVYWHDRVGFSESP